jgi:hypothetical protein
MNDKIEISRELIERTLPCIYKSEKRGAQVAEELRQALDRSDMAAKAHAMKREGQGAGAGEVLRSMTQQDWEAVATNATIGQQATLIASYKKIIGRYQHLCGELYQVLGALDAPAYVLDRVSNASDSMVITNTPSLLPFDKHAWPIKQSIVLPPYRTGHSEHESVLISWNAWNACLDKVKELNK